MNVLLFAIAILLIALVVKIWLDPNRIKPMSNEQIRDERKFRRSYLDERIKRGLPSYSFIKHNPRNNRKTKGRKK